MSVRNRGSVVAIVCTGLLAVGVLGVGCSGPAQTIRGKVSKNDAVIQIQCEVGDAELWVDDRFVAHVRSLRRGIALSPGEHRLEIRHDRHHTHYEILTVTARERRTLTVEMARILP